MKNNILKIPEQSSCSDLNLNESLEKKFRKTLQNSNNEMSLFLKEIDNYIDQMKKLDLKIQETAQELESISERFGIPFSYYSPELEHYVDHCYKPKSFDQIWEGLDRKFLYDLLGFASSQNIGWRHSSC